MKRRILAGNWKMHKTAAQARDFMRALLPLVPSIPEDVEPVICPPFTALHAVQDAHPRIKLGAQNVHWEASGAFTGEIAAPMLLEYGVSYVIVGHSERRQYFGESDRDVRRRAAAALQAGITPIICVGESLETRSAGDAQTHVVAQTRAALQGLTLSDVSRVVMAYEPIWAIGTGQNCDAHEANAVMRAIRQSVDGLQEAPVLYGGSVKPENIEQYCAMPDIDGGLVGGASLDPQSFIALAKGASAG